MSKVDLKKREAEELRKLAEAAGELAKLQKERLLTKQEAEELSRRAT